MNGFLELYSTYQLDYDYFDHKNESMFALFMVSPFLINLRTNSSRRLKSWNRKWEARHKVVSWDGKQQGRRQRKRRKRKRRRKKRAARVKRRSRPSCRK